MMGNPATSAVCFLQAIYFECGSILWTMNILQTAARLLRDCCETAVDAQGNYLITYMDAKAKKPCINFSDAVI